MNLYIVTEGSSTEFKLYPAWLDFYLPALSRITKPESAIGSSYYLISGHGQPSIINHTEKAIETILELWKSDNIRYDYLIVFVDSEDIPLAERKAELSQVMKDHSLPYCTQGIVIVQNKCIETWFLGNRSMFPNGTSCDIMQKCIKHYDVSFDDPELMERPPDYLHLPVVKFHMHYLKHMILAQTNKRCSYSKKNPGDTVKESYFRTLVSRYRETSHLSSFGDFINLLDAIKKQMSVV